MNTTPSHVCIPIRRNLVERALRSLDTSTRAWVTLETLADVAEQEIEAWLLASAVEATKSALSEAIHDDEALDEMQRVYGDPDNGIQWGPVFLNNSTDVRMTYKGRLVHGEVRHGAISIVSSLPDGSVISEDQRFTPSEFASRVANNTTRNAWRDVWVRWDGFTDWVLAEDLRRAVRPQPDWGDTAEVLRRAVTAGVLRRAVMPSQPHRRGSE